VRKLIALLSLLLAGTAPAVGQVPPYVYAPTLGTASVQILPVNPLRKRLMFINPNAAASVAVCPIGPTRVTGGVNVTAAINGAGCITLLPYGNMTIDGGEGGSGPQLFMPAAWVGIASAASSGLTVYEFE
jgi:hypothetical protein